MPDLRRTRAGLAVAIAALLCAAPAAAQQPAPLPPTTVTVTGTGTVKPTPLNRKNNASIAKAVRDARAAAAPLALADGRARAANLAALTGRALGELLAVSEGSGPSPFVFFGPYGEDGTFGPGRYCGIVRTPIYRTRNGKRTRVGFHTRRTCRVPPQVAVSLGMTFATTPAAA